jgi:hypothetical protein
MNKLEILFVLKINLNLKRLSIAILKLTSSLKPFRFARNRIIKILFKAK